MTSSVEGFAKPEFAPLRAEFANRITSGDETGASLVVFIGDELVVDLWGGWRDTARTDPWQADTMVNTWSLTKLVTAMGALKLIDAGELALDSPVSHYWPAFGAGGKKSVTVRHILSHTSGVPGWVRPFSLTQMYDDDAACGALAALVPRWQPGTVHAYHAQNYGHLIGALVRRASGVGLGAFLASEVAAVAEADFRLGAVGVTDDRIAQLQEPHRVRLELPDTFDRSVPADVFGAPPIDVAAAMTPAWRAAELGALNGHGNARSVAQILHPLACEGLDPNGRRILGKGTVEEVFTTRTQLEADRVLGVPLQWGLGLAHATPGNPAGIPPGPRMFWGGWGGSLAVVDPQARMTFAYTMNRMSPGVIGSPRSGAYVSALYRCVSESRQGVPVP